MAKVETKGADSTGIQTAPLLAEALAVQDNCSSIIGVGDGRRHLDVLKNKTKVRVFK